MIYLKLFLTFLKIGLFSFGGGYAMIPLIQKEIEVNGWMTSSEFIDIIAIAEMTPGPIAVNSATFVGYKTAGFWGGLAATTGVAIQSLILIIIVSRFFFKYCNHPKNKTILFHVRPIIAGLIITASLFVSETALFRNHCSFEDLLNLSSGLFNVINIYAILITAATLLITLKFKVHPIMAIALSAIAGIFLF